MSIARYPTLLPVNMGRMRDGGLPDPIANISATSVARSAHDMATLPPDLSIVLSMRSMRVRVRMRVRAPHSSFKK